MKILPASEESLQEAVSVIQNGGVVAHATETCYGLACDLTNESALKKLFALKKRPEGMPVSALFPSVEMAKEWVEWDEKAEELAEKYLPGPLTIVLPILHSQLSIIHSRTLGVRVSSHPIAQKLAELAGVPLSTTSANLHGQPEPYSAEEVAAQLQPDLILDSGVFPQSPSSTVVDVENGEIKILRQGAVHL